MTHVRPDPLDPSLRPPDEVMRLGRMGAFFPTRLSFMRSLVRHLNAGVARVTRPVWQIDDQGYGRAVYSVAFGGHTYSLVAFSTPLDPDDRTDRVIAEAWDTTYVLFDGVPGPGDLDRLQANVPRQEAGRFHASELVLCRANKSVRLFQHVVERLAQGAQPDRAEIGRVGYLMRTTAVYGNGKFGIADRAQIADRPDLSLPFRAEMLAVWLVRGFTLDLAEHVAACRNPGAARLAPDLRRHLGIGNATGLGMAPFLVNHPILLNNWMLARETALARVRNVPRADAATLDRFHSLLHRAERHVAEWTVDDIRQMNRIETLRRELPDLAQRAHSDMMHGARPWDWLMRQARRWSIEMQEMLVALVLEPHGPLVDDLALGMATETEPRIWPVMRAETLADLIKTHYAWALDYDFNDPNTQRQFWYVSADKLEPRLGDRFSERGADREMPLDIARQVQALARVLDGVPSDQTVAELAMRWPKLRSVIARVQAAPLHPYAEIRDNLIGADCRAIDLLRCKLSFFGASKFDPKSDRWTRITLFQGAPGFDEIGATDADDWLFPALGDATGSALDPGR